MPQDISADCIEGHVHAASAIAAFMMSSDEEDSDDDVRSDSDSDSDEAYNLAEAIESTMNVVVRVD